MYAKQLIWLWVGVIVVALLLSFVQLFKQGAARVFVPPYLMLRCVDIDSHPDQGARYLDYIADVITQEYHLQSVFLHTVDSEVRYRSFFVSHSSPVQVTVQVPQSYVLTLHPGDLLVLPVNCHLDAGGNSNRLVEHRWGLHPFVRRLRLSQSEQSTIVSRWNKCQIKFRETKKHVRNNSVQKQVVI